MEKNDMIANLQAQLAQRNIENDTLSSDKKNLQDELADTRKVLDEKKRVLLQATKTAHKQKEQHKDGSSAQYQLELENQRLRTTVTELEENESELVQELELVSEERSDFESKNEQLAAKCDQLQNDLDTRTLKVTSLETDYEELSLKVEAENDAQMEWEEKTAKKAEAHRKERAKVREERMQLYEYGYITNETPVRCPPPLLHFPPQLMDNLEVERNRVRNLEAKVEVRRSEEQSNDLITQSQAAKIARARTFVHDAPHPQPPQ